MRRTKNSLAGEGRTGLRHLDKELARVIIGIKIDRDVALMASDCELVRIDGAQRLGGS
jgi:hypothetical protein